MASLELIKQNAQLLKETRLSYLNEATNRTHWLKSIGWVGLGAVLVSAATILTFAVPFIAIPAIVAGALVLGYGVADFANTTTKAYTKLNTSSLGERSLGEPIKAKLNAFAQTLGESDVDSFITQKKLEKQPWSRRKKLGIGLGIGLSLLGLGLAAAALTLAFPMVGAPLAAVIAVAVASMVLAATTVTLSAIKFNQKKKARIDMEQSTKQNIESDLKLTNQLSLTVSPHHTLGSTAQILMDEKKASETLNMHLNPPSDSENPSNDSERIKEQPAAVDDKKMEDASLEERLHVSVEAYNKMHERLHPPVPHEVAISNQKNDEEKEDDSDSIEEQM